MHIHILHVHAHAHAACAYACNKPRLQERLVLPQPLVVRAFALLVIRMSPRERGVFMIGFHALDRVDGSELVILHVADVRAVCRK